MPAMSGHRVFRTLSQDSTLVEYHQVRRMVQVQAIAGRAHLGHTWDYKREEAISGGGGDKLL